MTSMARSVPPLTEHEQQCAIGDRGVRPMTIRLGTRASALATAQSDWVAGQLRNAGHEVTLVPVSTEGDRSRASLREIGGTGVFAAALRTALLEDRIDIAVHSLKDLPVAPLDGLAVAAVPSREDPRDVLVSAGNVALADLPAGAVIGTGSPRRAAQLAVVAPQVQVRDIRGNVGTRLQMVTDGDLDGVVLAYAGLRRLGLTDVVTEVLDFDRMLPAPGQGALAVECRSDDAAMIAAVAFLNDAETRRCVEAERLLLATLEAGCTAPVAAGARLLQLADAAAIELTAFAAIDDRADRHTLVGSSEQELADDLAALFLPESVSGAAERSDHPYARPSQETSPSSVGPADDQTHRQEAPARPVSAQPPADGRPHRPEPHGSKQPEREK